MDNETNLDNLFDDVFPAQEAVAGDDGQQKDEIPAEEKTQQEEPQKPQEQSKDERAAQAAARREREERERRREQRAYQQARADMSALLKELGIERDDGSTIDTVEDLEAVAKARREDRLSKGSPTEADIQAIVDERLRQAQAPQQQGLSPEERAEVDRQLAEIRAMDPAMTDLNAILSSEAGPKFREYVYRGLGFTEAYKLAAEERLAGIKSNRQGARTGGKDHLTSTSQRGGGDVEVPAETKEMYRLLMPDMTDEQIQKAYNADRRKFGG